MRSEKGYERSYQLELHQNGSRRHGAITNTHVATHRGLKAKS